MSLRRPGEHVVDIADDPDDPDRAVAECRECCSASSGSLIGVERWADRHEKEHRGDL